MNRNRTAEEIIVLGICFICLSGLVPFVFVRLYRGDIIVAFIDLVGAIVTVACIWHVVKTGSTKYVAPIIGILSLAGMTANISLLGPSEIYFLYPVVIAAFFLMPPPIALLATLLVVSIIAYIIGPFMPVLEALKLIFSLLATAMFTFTFAWQRNRQKDDLRALSQIDQLTGAGNRRALHEQLELFVHSYKRDQQPMSLIILDLDDFKEINDLHGHLSGDEVLIALTKIIKARIRVTDFLYRFGGDEFMILATHSNLETTRVLAEDIRKLTYQESFFKEGNVSVSIGVSEYQSGETPDEWLLRADSAMYTAKRSGKNVVATMSNDQASVGLAE